MAVTKDPRVDEYIADSELGVKPLLVLLRRGLHRNCPGIVETIKWNIPFFMFDEKLLCGIAGFKAHAGIGFWNSSYNKVLSKNDVPTDVQFKMMIKKALASQKSKAISKKTVAKKTSKKKK